MAPKRANKAKSPQDEAYQPDEEDGHLSDVESSQTLQKMMQQMNELQATAKAQQERKRKVSQNRLTSLEDASKEQFAALDKRYQQEIFDLRRDHIDALAQQLRKKHELEVKISNVIKTLTQQLVTMSEDTAAATKGQEEALTKA